MILGFHHKVDEICALLGCYTVYTCNVYRSCKPTFCYIVGLYAMACRDVPKSFSVLCQLTLILLTLERHSSLTDVQVDIIFFQYIFSKLEME